MIKKQPILSVEQTQNMDQKATETFGIPSLLLMENAGRSVAECIETLIPKKQSPKKVLAICGGGNNGGDGFVAARHLFQRGWVVKVILAARPEDLKGDAALNYRMISKLGVVVESYSTTTLFSHDDFHGVLIDALLGTGFHGALRPQMEKIINDINAFKKRRAKKMTVVSVDIPSGLSEDDGRLGNAVKADHTLTFSCLKPGLLTLSAKAFVGRLHVVDIGIPRKLLDSYVRQNALTNL